MWLSFAYPSLTCLSSSFFLSFTGMLRQSLPMAIPSLLYVCQNSLQFIAIQYLDATVFSIMSQLKILTTAVCSVLILGTHLSLRKWRALFLLVIGCIMVQYPEGSAKQAAQASAGATSLLGMGAVLGMVCLSGLAGISVEKALKASSAPTAQASADGSVAALSRPATLWERNVQLSWYGLLFGLGSVVTTDWATVSTLGFFHGFSAAAWFVVMTAAAGGLIVAVVVKYTNTIVKGFATSLSIIVTSLVSLVLFPEIKLTFLFWLGAACVLTAIFNYNEEELPQQQQQQQQPTIEDPAKVPVDADSSAEKGEQDEWVRETERLLPAMMDDVPDVIRDVRLMMGGGHEGRA